MSYKNNQLIQRSLTEEEILYDAETIALFHKLNDIKKALNERCNPETSILYSADIESLKKAIEIHDSSKIMKERECV